MTVMNALLDSLVRSKIAFNVRHVDLGTFQY